MSAAEIILAVLGALMGGGGLYYVSRRYKCSCLKGRGCICEAEIDMEDGNRNTNTFLNTIFFHWRLIIMDLPVPFESIGLIYISHTTLLDMAGCFTNAFSSIVW